MKNCYDPKQDEKRKKMQTPAVLSFCGSWSGISAGGSFEYASWRYNPQLFVKAEKPCSVKIVLSQERQAVSVRVTRGVPRSPPLARSSSRLASTSPGRTARAIA